MAKQLQPWDGRKLCTLELADAYTDSECALPLMGTQLVFQKGITDRTHPYARSKDIALTYLEAESLNDGRFTVALVKTDAPSDESKTDRAAKAAKAAKAESQE